MDGSEVSCQNLQHDLFNVLSRNECFFPRLLIRADVPQVSPTMLQALPFSEQNFEFDSQLHLQFDTATGPEVLRRLRLQLED